MFFFFPQNTTYFRKPKVIRRITCTPSLDPPLGLVFVFTRADHKPNGSGFKFFSCWQIFTQSKIHSQNRASAEKYCHTI